MSEGHIKSRFIDLSNRQLTTADTIVIGGLLADNPHVRKLNLKDNSFANSEGSVHVVFIDLTIIPIAW